MNIYFLMTDEPVFSPVSCRIFLERYPGRVVGASFPGGMINKKRLVSTIGIYGLVRFFKLGFSNLVWGMAGGRVANIFRRNKIKVYQVRDINSPEFIALIKQLSVDLIISFNCPQPLRRELIELPGKGCINIHFGMLPEYRGILPIMYALLNGEEYFGVSVHYIDEKLDSGDIILQEKVPITQKDTLDTLYPKAFETAGYLLIKAVDMIENDAVKRIYNDPVKKTYYTYPDKETIEQYRRLCLTRQR